MGWPFWAGTSDERVDEALRLAGLRPGERLLDLGCGDGRVLLRAAEADVRHSVPMSSRFTKKSLVSVSGRSVRTPRVDPS